MLTQGKGCVWQKQLYKYGYGEGPPPESLRKLADDTDQGRVLVLEPLVVSAEVGQGLWDGMGQLGDPGPAAPAARSAPLVFTFSSSSSSAAFLSRALRSWNKLET